MSATETLAAVPQSIGKWASQPFTASMGATGWFLFVGLLIGISAAWALILKDLKGEL